MDLRELRLGNLVYVFDNQVCEISAIGHDCWVELLDPEEMQSTSQNPEKHQLTPIPLTEEWLNKLGWAYNKRTLSFENGDARMHLEYRKLNGSYTMFNYVLKAKIAERIWYVHQLQNLYFALTGEELTIKQTSNA